MLLLFFFPLEEWITAFFFHRLNIFATNIYVSGGVTVCFWEGVGVYVCDSCCTSGSFYVSFPALRVCLNEVGVNYVIRYH